MTQTVYDPDSDERPLHHDAPDPLHEITGIGPAEAQRINDREVTDDIGRREGLFNPDGDGNGSGGKKASADDLRAAESNGGETSSSDGSLFNKDGDKQTGLRGRVQNTRNKVKSKVNSVKQNKWLMGIGIGLLPILGIAVIVLIILAGALKLPDVANSIEAYEFVQVTRQFSESANSATEEALATEATTDPAWYDLKGRFTASETYTNIRSTTWGKLDGLRPGLAIKNQVKALGDAKNLQIRTKVGVSGRAVFTGGSYDGIDYNVEPVTGAAKWTPVLRNIKAAQNRAVARGALLDAVDTDMRTGETSTLVRSGTMLSLRKMAGGRFEGWVLDEFANLKKGETPDTVQTKQMSNATEAGNTADDNAKTDDIAKGDKTEADTLEKDINDPATLAKIVADGGDDEKAAAATDAAVKTSALKSVINVTDPLYKIFVPICIIYDGSVQRSQPSIDNNMNRQENAFDTLAADADHQKTGDENSSDDAALGTAIGATNDEIGDISQSIPYQQSATGQSDTSSTLSSEAGSDGGYTYSVFNLAGLSDSGATSKVLNKVVGSVCPVLSSLKVGIGLSLLNGAVAVFTGGTSETAEEGAGEAASAAVADTTEQVAEKALDAGAGKEAEEAAGQAAGKAAVQKSVQVVQRTKLNRAMRFAVKQGAIIGGTVGLTILAHLEIANRSGEANNGVAQGTDLINEAGAGADIESNRSEQSLLFGRPLLPNEVSQLDGQNKTYLTDQNSKQSFTDRYFATSNPNSLFSHVALDINANAHITTFGSILRLGSIITVPFKSFGSLITSVGHAQAAIPPSALHYGNVQFGWSADEEKLIKSSVSYDMLENQEQLDKAPQVNGMTAEQAAAKKYSTCFGYNYSSQGDDLDPTDTSGNLQLSTDDTLGNLLAKGDIQRDDDGNVVDPGSSQLCSKTNLSYNNSEFGPQVVFRWRLAMRYDAVVNTETQYQSAPTSSTDTQTTDTST